MSRAAIRFTVQPPQCPICHSALTEFRKRKITSGTFAYTRKCQICSHIWQVEAPPTPVQLKFHFPG